MVTRELLDYIQKVTAATTAGTIKWIRMNPTTFGWQPNQQIMVSIQKIEHSQPTLTAGGKRAIVRKSVYVFNVAGGPSLSAKSSDSEEITEPLRQLYEAADKNATIKAVEALNSLLP
jgi:hypothetical protein